GAVVVPFTEAIGVLEPIRSAAKRARLVLPVQQFFRDTKFLQDLGPSPMHAQLDSVHARFELLWFHVEAPSSSCKRSTQQTPLIGRPRIRRCRASKPPAAPIAAAAGSRGRARSRERWRALRIASGPVPPGPGCP